MFDSKLMLLTLAIVILVFAWRRIGAGAFATRGSHSRNTTLSVLLRCLVSLVLLAVVVLGSITLLDAIHKNGATAWPSLITGGLSALVSLVALRRVWLPTRLVPAPPDPQEASAPAEPVAIDPATFDAQGFDRWLTGNGFDLKTLEPEMVKQLQSAFMEAQQSGRS